MLYEICLRTAASGEDGSELFRSAPESVGDLYAVPYAEFAPELITILDDGSGACGYVLGVSDTAAYEDWLEAHWFPLLRQRYQLPQDGGVELDAASRLIRRFHGPVQREAASLLAEYPAHLHIDLLPRAQGQGLGRQLMETFLAALRVRGVAGVHLGLGAANLRALGFYRRLGFSEIERRGEPTHSLVMGLKLA